VVPANSDFPNSEVNAQPPGAAASNSLAYARTAPDQLSAAAKAAARSAAEYERAHAPTAPTGLPPPQALKPIIPAPDPDAPLPNAATPAAPVASAAAEKNPFSSTAPAPALGQPMAFTPEPVPATQPTVKPAAASPAAPAAKASSSSTVKPPLLNNLSASYDHGQAATGFSASKLFAVDVDEVQHDPELEEASIRFANGDDAGAEAGLMEAIHPKGPRHLHDETWLTLFDLYRATGQYDRFESLAIDFASRFHRSAPAWFSIPEMVSRAGGAADPVPTEALLRKSDWKCPANMGVQTVATMTVALSKKPMPWTLDWSSLQNIDEAALPALVKLFMSWGGQPVQLRFAHTQKLDDVLRNGAPSGVKTTSQDRWKALLEFLRISHRPDEFELAALDFCVTYEVSPPSWESARCEFKMLDTEGNTKAGQTIIGEAVHDSITSELVDMSGTSSQMTAQMATVEMAGQIMGEPKPVLDKLEARLLGADVMTISCAKLIRVDFSAAGSLLNWVTAQQTDGRLVQFNDVHRLVAAFFHVIGISEHAKVNTRKD
jgi:ABC-type transporter Mla MlaB component